MGGKITKFELREGNRIWLIVEHLVWGEWLPLHQEDVTEKIMPTVDDYLDVELGLTPQSK